MGKTFGDHCVEASHITEPNRTEPNWLVQLSSVAAMWTGLYMRLQLHRRQIISQSKTVNRCTANASCKKKIAPLSHRDHAMRYVSQILDNCCQTVPKKLKDLHYVFALQASQDHRNCQYSISHVSLPISDR